MARQILAIVVLLSAGLAGAHGKPAEAANEDVPKGPSAPPPSQASGKSQGGQQQPATGSVSGGHAKSAPSGGGGGAKGGTAGK